MVWYRTAQYSTKHVRSYKIHLKSVAIGQGTLISHSGIIRRPLWNLDGVEDVTHTSPPGVVNLAKKIWILFENKIPSKSSKNNVLSPGTL